MMKGMASSMGRRVEDQIKQEIEGKKQLSLQYNKDIQDLTQQLKIQKIRNEVFER